jgi:hypothetical protein
MIIGALGGYYFRHKKIKFILETPLLIIVGVCSGALLKLFDFQSDLDTMCAGFPYIFFLVLFPSIMFQALFAINKV